MAVGKHGNDEYRELAENGLILRVRTGSVTHGISTESSDRDEMGVCIEPPQFVIGLRKFEQYMYRDAAQRTGKFDARSAAGELDLTIYSLRKFVRLALNGNPSIIEILFIRHLDSVVWTSRWGKDLQQLAPLIVSREAGPKYLGYLHAQRRSMESKEGKGRDVTRPELVEKYGFDTKYAGHMIRLGYQGRDLMRDGLIRLPMPAWQADHIRQIRTGQVSLKECLALAEVLEGDIRQQMDRSILREHPDRDTLNTWLINTYAEAWGAWGMLPEWL